MASVGSFLAELKRRRVFRVLAGYCAAALVAIEAANNIFPALALPPWATRLVVVLALVGLPVALILAWAFDVTPDGLTRDTGSAPAEAAPSAARGGGGRLALYAGAAVVLALGAAAVYGRVRPAGTARASAGASVAVLPFANLSGDAANEYFSDGITEEILNALANVPGLRVPARTSSFAFKGKSGDVAAIGRQLHATHVLEGSVQREGDRVRITTQLVDARTGYHQWSRAYTLNTRDLFAVEDEISRDVARELRMRLEPGVALSRGGTEDTRAHDLYLQGRSVRFSGALNRDAWKANLLEAASLYQRALEVDSTYALAWSALAEVYETLADDFWPPRDAYPRSRQAALRAIALDPKLSQAHTMLAHVRYWFDWDYPAGDRESERALALNPNDPDVHSLRALRYEKQLSFAAEVREAEAADRLDPAAGWGSLVLHARALAGGGHLLDSLRAARARNPDDLATSAAAFEVAFRAGRWREAAALIPVLRRAAPGLLYDQYEALVLARAGDTATARRRLDEIVASSRGRYVRAALVAAVYANLGQREAALQWLERADRERDGTLLELYTWDWWDPLRGDPRFEALKRRVPRAPTLR